MAKIENSAHRPYAAFGLSMLVHAFALFGVMVTLPQAPATTAPGAFAVSLISVASASEPLAAPAPPPPTPRQPQRVAKRVATPTSQPEIVTQRDAPAENIAPPAETGATAPAPVAADADATASASAAPSQPGPASEAPSPPQFAAAYLRNPAPAYPAHSRRQGEEGRVLLRVHVLANGQPDDIVIHQSSSHERLDEAAIDAVRRWKFVPAKAGGVAIAAWVIVPIQFNLRGVG